MEQQFIAWLDKVAAASGRTSAEVRAMWQEYCRDCRNYDQSPVGFEFCQWYGLVDECREIPLCPQVTLCRAVAV